MKLRPGIGSALGQGGELPMQDPEPKPPRPGPKPDEPHLPGPDPDPPGPDVIDPPVQAPMWT